MAQLSTTDTDREEMLAAIGVSSVDELFRDIPAGVRFQRELDLEPAWQDSADDGTWSVDDPDGATEFDDLAALVSGDEDATTAISTAPRGDDDDRPPPAVATTPRRRALPAGATPSGGGTGAPPAIAGSRITVAPGATGVSRPSSVRTSSPPR